MLFSGHPVLFRSLKWTATAVSALAYAQALADEAFSAMAAL